MGLLLTVSSVYVPGYFRKRNLETLFESTAEAFRVEPPSTRELTLNDSLKSYAEFTRAQALKSIRQANTLEIQLRLFKNARKLGEQFRADFKLNTMEQMMRMSAVIYSQLKIELHGQSQGDIIIKHCFFSYYYSAEVCQVISSLDAGLLSGLSNGGVLRFSQRITEGKDCCKAYLEMRRKTK